jgi:hypothetical protein
MSATFPFEPTVYLGKMPLPVAEAMRDALSDTDPTPMNEAAFAWLNAAIALADPGPQTCAECHRAFEEGDEMLFNFDGEYVHACARSPATTGPGNESTPVAFGTPWRTDDDRPREDRRRVRQPVSRVLATAHG